MNRGADVASMPDLSEEVVPRRQPAADLALRELDDEGRQRLLHGLEVANGHESARVADGEPDQSV